MNKSIYLCVLGMAISITGCAAGMFIKHDELIQESELQFYVLEKVSQKYYKDKIISAEVYEQFLLSKVKGEDLTGSAPAYLSLFYGHKGMYKDRDDLLMHALSSYPSLELYNLLSANLPIFNVEKQSEIASLVRNTNVSAMSVNKALNSTATHLRTEEVNKLRQCYEILGADKSEFEDPTSWKNTIFHTTVKSKCSSL